jgi:type I restriction enzyme M protein
VSRLKKDRGAGKTTAANVGYEAQLWQMADALRGSMDAAEYKHVALGQIFLKYISDAFEEQHARLEAERAHGADPEDPDEYRAINVFWVPPEARWVHLKAQAKQPTIGQLVDDAMAGIERDNPSLKGVLPKDYARPALDKQRLGQLIDLVSNIRVGDAESRARDVLGRHPRHRRPDRPRRHLPRRPPPGSQGRLRPGQPALQRERPARRPSARGQSAGGSASRPPATPTSPGCST